jgi:tetratricopeptide (TPR) repeat protein
MSASSLVKDIGGVLVCAVGDSDGHVLEYRPGDPNNETMIAAGAFTGKQLEQLGNALGIGVPTSLVVSGSTGAFVVALRPRHVFVAKCDSARTATAVEAKLVTSDWTKQIEAFIDDSELEYMPAGRQPEPQKPAKPVRAPLPKTEAKPVVVPKIGSAIKATPQKTLTAMGRPPLPRATANLQEAVILAHNDALLAELRRTLVKGQLRQAEIVGAKLVDSAKSRNASTDTVPLPARLLEGIAMVLAGDAVRALSYLKDIESSTKDPSLCWTSLIWCARASAGAALDVAKGYAQSALSLASQLDVEARAVSTFELAGVAFNQGNANEALELTHSARSLFGDNSDPQLSAGCWLLEARILATLGNREESIAAARQARERRPSWPPPATFIAKQALGDGRLKEAEQVLDPLLATEPIATEIERVNGIIKYVRTGVVPAHTAFEFLDLVDAPPTSDNIHKLEELSERHPQIEHFREALGWHLLRTGQYESASVVFERLGERNDISDDVRSSVLLALGCLATNATHLSKPEVRIRAAVEATPKTFKSSKPTTPSSGKMRAAAPVEFRHSDSPRLAATTTNGPPASGAERATNANDKSMFSGNLQLFALPDLLEFLRSGQRTGTLLCSSSAGIGAINLKRGRITGAASPETKGLRDYLIAMGVVTSATLENIDQTGSGERALIGSTLVKMGVATAEQVRLALRDQVRDAVKELMSWGAGQFAFDPEAVSEFTASEIQVEFDPQEVLLNIFKELDETSTRRF